MKGYINLELEKDYAIDLLNSLLYYDLMMKMRGIEVSGVYYGFVSRLYEKIYGSQNIFLKEKERGESKMQELKKPKKK